MTVHVSTQQTATPGASGAVPRHSFQKERRRTPSRPLRRRGARLDPSRRVLCAGAKCLQTPPCAAVSCRFSRPLREWRFAQAQWRGVAAPFPGGDTWPGSCCSYWRAGGQRGRRQVQVLVAALWVCGQSDLGAQSPSLRDSVKVL